MSEGQAETRDPIGGAPGWLRMAGVAVAAGLFLAFSGAFVGEFPFVTRLVYWTSLMLLGSFWGGVVARMVFGAYRPGKKIWPRALAEAFMIAVPGIAVVGVANGLAFGAWPSWRSLPYLALAVFAISLVMTTINVLIVLSRRPPEVIVQAAAKPVRFLDRLPPKLRGAQVWAVESEDHYLRLHTSKGQDLILMRLADAVAELEGIEGAQVHRSWWVARDAVIDIKRGDGRATLTLKDGVKVPVSRTHAPVLRERGWV